MASSRQSSEQGGDGNLSEAESDTSSVMGDTSSVDGSMKPPSPASREQLSKRMESLIQENRVLKVELETLKIRVRTLQEENRALKEASVKIQAKAEQEEEFISNTLLKKIQELKKEKETLALNYEQEEECLTNDLSRKLVQLRHEKAELSATLQNEQESMIGKLLRKIKKMEAETNAKQLHLEQLRREKIELENTLEQEQEALVNRLWKRMDKLEAEKQCLQTKLDQPLSAPPSPMDTSTVPSSPGVPMEGNSSNSSDPSILARDIKRLRGEVLRLRQQLRHSQNAHCEKMAHFAREEQQVREENLRLQRKLQLEVERREQLCRNLSESESSLEMEDERHFNELSSSSSSTAQNMLRGRTVSSPVGYPHPSAGRPISPAVTSGLNINTNLAFAGYNPPSPSTHHRCAACGSALPPQVSNSQAQVLLSTTSPPPLSFTSNASTAFVPATARTRSLEKGEKFLRPANPTPRGSVGAGSPSNNTSSSGFASASSSSNDQA